MTARKFSAGEPIVDVAELTRLICAGEWVMLHRRPCHPAFLGSMQLNTLRALCRAGRVAYAVRTDP